MNHRIVGDHCINWERKLSTKLWITSVIYDSYKVKEIKWVVSFYLPKCCVIVDKIVLFSSVLSNGALNKHLKDTTKTWTKSNIRTCLWPQQTVSCFKLFLFIHLLIYILTYLVCEKCGISSSQFFLRLAGPALMILIPLRNHFLSVYKACFSWAEIMSVGFMSKNNSKILHVHMM